MEKVSSMSRTPGLGAAGGPPASKTAYALERLRQEIDDGIIRPGEALRQADLANRYGISPTPVREALRLLEAEGAISYSPHRGATVSELTEERVNDLYLLRASSEALVTRLAAERRTTEQLSGIRDLHGELAKLVDAGKKSHEELAAWNRELHLAIGTAGSPLIATQVTNVWRMIPTRNTMWKQPELTKRFVDQHELIVTAIADGDAEAARAAMEDHIMTAVQWRLRSMS